MTVHDRSWTIGTRRLGIRTLAALSALALWVAALAVATEGRAAPDQTAAARVLFKRARVLMDKGEFARACPLLEDSLQLEDGMGTRFNLAHCWEHIGKVASAWSLFSEVADAAKALEQPEREAAARGRADALAERLSYVVLMVTEELPEMIVGFDDERIPASGWGAPFPVDIGQYDLVVSAPERETYRTHVAVWEEGKTVRVVVPMLTPVLTEDMGETYVAEQAVLSGSTSEDSLSRPSWAYWTAGGAAALGVAGLVLGITAHVRASDAASNGDRVCPERGAEGCSAREINAYDHYYSQQEHWNQRAQIGYGAAAIGLVSGLTILWLTGESPESERTPPLSLDWPRRGIVARVAGSF